MSDDQTDRSGDIVRAGRVTQLGYVGLEVRDLDGWTDFATRILGLQWNPESDADRALFRLDDYHHRLVIHGGDRDDLTTAGWQVADAPALEQVAERLERLGHDVAPGTPDEARDRNVSGFVRTDDPDGVATEIYHGPLIVSEEPFRSPRPIGRFVAGDLGLGHIVLGVDDVESNLRFYREGLGLRTSDYIDFDVGDDEEITVSFLHCGPRHHSLALAAGSGPQRLHHIMFEVADLDDVGSTYDLCQRNGVPIAASLGRHTNDKMLSFYLRTPSGFQVEYGYGGRLVDDATWEVQRHRSPSIWGHHTVG